MIFYKRTKVGIIKCLKFRLIIPSIVYALLILACICSLKDRIYQCKLSMVLSFFVRTQFPSISYTVCDSELPIFTSKAHVFHIDPDTKKKWLPLSTQAVSVSYYHDSARYLYRVISVDGTKVRTSAIVACL